MESCNGHVIVMGIRAHTSWVEIFRFLQTWIALHFLYGLGKKMDKSWYPHPYLNSLLFIQKVKGISHLFIFFFYFLTPTHSFILPINFNGGGELRLPMPFSFLMVVMVENEYLVQFVCLRCLVLNLFVADNFFEL